jgi:hypothetical protein
MESTQSLQSPFPALPPPGTKPASRQADLTCWQTPKSGAARNANVTEPTAIAQRILVRIHFGRMFTVSVTSDYEDQRILDVDVKPCI